MDTNTGNISSSAAYTSPDMARSIKRGLLINRIILIAILVLLVGLCAGAGYAAYNAYLISHDLKPVYEILSNVDYEKINTFIATLDEINKIDFEGITKTINDIDFEGVKEILNSIDVEELKQGMESLKNASEMLEAVSEKVAPILSWFK